MTTWPCRHGPCSLSALNESQSASPAPPRLPSLRFDITSILCTTSRRPYRGLRPLLNHRPAKMPLRTPSAPSMGLPQKEQRQRPDGRRRCPHCAGVSPIEIAYSDEGPPSRATEIKGVADARWRFSNLARVAVKCFARSFAPHPLAAKICG